jgi:peptidyl-dipeptidase A
MRSFALVVALCLASSACTETHSAPNEAEARKFVEDANRTMLALSVEGNRANWVAETYITEDTQALSARASQAYIDTIARLAKQSVRFDKVDVPPDIRRQLNLLRLNLTLASPSDPRESEELTNIAARLSATYGKGKWCEDPRTPETCLDIDKITNIIAESRDEKRLRQVWEGWHTIAPPMRKDYSRLVELSNKGARELGFADTGAMWRSKYDMPDAEYTKELERLWDEMRPLYIKLHAYVRMKLREKYGNIVPAAGPMPAHILGDIWAQDWANVYPLVKPATADVGYDLEAILKSRKTTPVEMVKMGERFYTSIGFSPLPETFWTRSILARPRDRDLVCHAAAADIDNGDDLRIKMCIEPREEDFHVIHHELGHNFYQRAYKDLPFLFRDSANDGVHEAIGDAIALSVTPEYLVKIGLINKVPDSSNDVGLLLSKALEKVAFLPFGLLIDEWRWKVFSGEIKPENYNAAWWELRLKYQGIAPVSPRGEEFFDPGAKYHIPGNTPYARYFMAHIFQFQFHRALSRIADCHTPLVHCSIYENKQAGDRLNAMLAMGLSRPWPDAIETLTGSREMDASALLEYFAPLDKWLDDQLKGKPVGW